MVWLDRAAIFRMTRVAIVKQGRRKCFHRLLLIEQQNPSQEQGKKLCNLILIEKRLRLSDTDHIVIQRSDGFAICELVSADHVVPLTLRKRKINFHFS